jgi:phage tail sheath protein FI
MGSAAYNEAEAQSLANKLIAIAEQRKDALAFVSPYRASQIIDGQSGAQTVIDSETITSKVISFYSTVASSSYVVFDTGYKYMYDRFADKFRYVPLNGDIAGCCARTDQIAFPWFSPAGTTRGAILNGVRLAYNPTLIQRDRLYSARINPVIFSNDVGGITLFGDKTGLSASSAFDRINVRRLFIYVEEAITAAAQDQLFEFNDEVTRTNFVNIVEPFLRDVKSKRGITDFLVVCDETNNTPAVVDRNEFVADIFIKPTRSINFIGLTFVATRTGVNFEEVVGTV